MFPLTFSGAFTLHQPSISSDTLEDVLASIAERLEREKPNCLSRSGDRIEFRGGILRFVSSWNQLVAISYGEIRAERQPSGISVRYRIRFTQLVIVVTIMVGGFLSVPVAGAGNLSVAGKVAVLAVAWLWLAGGNIAITTYRFPRLLRQAAVNALDAA